MRYFFIFILSITLPFCLHAQPSRDWVSYFSGHFTAVSAIHYDRINDCIYIAGETGDSFGVATDGSFKEHFVPEVIDSFYDYSDKDIFLAKFSTEGTLLWGTYFGGEGMEYHPNVKTDHSGNVYITGISFSQSDIATPGTHLETIGTGKSAYFIAKFNPEGDRIWSTYFVQPDSVVVDGLTYYLSVGEFILGIDFDNDNNLYIAGSAASRVGVGTEGTHKPEPNVPEMTFGGAGMRLDALLAKFDSNGVQQWGTYFGGGQWDVGLRVACSEDGGVYLTGHTLSDTGIAYNSLYQDAIYMPLMSSSYLARFDTDGQLEWSTYITGSSGINVQNIACDSLGGIYLYGMTMSPDFISTEAAYQESLQGVSDLFLMKFSNTGEKIWGTYIGGEGQEFVYNSNDNPYFYSLVLAGKPFHLFFGGRTDGGAGLATECTYETEVQDKGLIGKFTTDGEMVWVSHYEDMVGDISARVNEQNITEIFVSGRTFVNGITTDGAHLESKPSWRRSGLIGKFLDEYDCNIDTLFAHLTESFMEADTGFDTYQWYAGDIPIAGASESTLALAGLTPGYYSCVAQKCGCIYYSDTLSYGISGVEPISGSEYISLYPNPASDILYIDFNTVYPASIRLYIYDILGKVIFEKTIVPDKQHVYQLIISEFPKGMYLLHLEAEAQSYKFKFVKR